MDLEADVIGAADSVASVVPALSALPALESDDDRIEFGMARAEVAASHAAIAMAEQLSAIDDAVREACACPSMYVGPDAGGREAVEFARRAAVASLAVTLGISENAVNAYAATATTLRSRLPRVLERFRGGEISYQKVSIITEQAGGLPEDPDTSGAFDAAMADAATRFTPAKLRLKARAEREKLHPESPVVRHARAAQGRRVWVDAAADGMAWLGALLPADVAYLAMARVNANAAHLAAQTGEGRTLEQLRADVLAALLTGEGTPAAVRATVTVTIPMLTLLDQDTLTDYRNNPAILDGYGPIDPDTARRLCAKAPSLYRLLTDPVDGARLTVGRTSYRPPADLKRLLKALHPRCSFPGCNRAADGCDIDHILDWLLGGRTELLNLAVTCRHHHRLKHKTRWRLTRTEPGGQITWTSPTGTTHNTDPPPF